MPEKRGGGDRNPAANNHSETSAAALLRKAGAVHDINQMLAVIVGRAELLLMREGSGSRREDLEAIVLAAGDAAAMIKRLQRGLPEDQRDGSAAVVNLRDAVRAVSLLIRPEGTGSWAKAGHDESPGSWVLEQDVPADLFSSVPGQVVREVLSNLLINALEVLPAGGRINIAASARQGRVTLSVTDNGPGLDKDLAGRIFEPGFSSSGEEFRGVGLAGSRQLLKCFDGRLDLDSEQGIGARFLVDLPRIDRVVHAAEEKNRGETEPGSRPAGFPVLVVDDDTGVRDMLTDVLTELDCRVTPFRDAHSALEGFAPGKFGLALVDQSLPGRSGLELASLLRKQDQSLVIVLITGWGREELLAGADKAIVDLTATKPLEWKRLNEILDKSADLLRQRRLAGSG
ncbi:MAG: ATP-binding protein [Candidatus Krumholzibacteriota bacterium]